MEVKNMEKVSEVNKTTNICPECGGIIISIQEKGEIVCRQCGLIINERNLDYSHSGRRAFTNQEKINRERTGSPISRLLPDMGLTTVIDRKNINNPDLKRAAKWNTRLTWEKRNLLIAVTELKRICNNLDLPEHIKEEAMRLYKMAFEKKLIRGRTIKGMVAACIYYACRSQKVPRSLQEILDQTSERPKDVRRYYSTLIKEFNLKTPSTDPITLVPKYIVDIGLDAEIESLTKNLLNAYISRIPTSGKDPKGIVAGIIYLACKLREKNITQKEIADIVGVTEVTLRSRFKELVKKLDIEI